MKTISFISKIACIALTAMTCMTFTSCGGDGSSNTIDVDTNVETGMHKVVLTVSGDTSNWTWGGNAHGMIWENGHNTNAVMYDKDGKPQGIIYRMNDGEMSFTAMTDDKGMYISFTLVAIDDDVSADGEINFSFHGYKDNKLIKKENISFKHGQNKGGNIHSFTFTTSTIE